MNSKVQSILARYVFLILIVWPMGPVSADSPAVIHRAANLPIPCAGGCGGDNLSWTSAPNVASWHYAVGDATKMVVTQQADKAILNWQNFNIGRNNSLQFIQPNADSEILNRIYGAEPSSIAGRMTANGKVYLLNQNGIVFKDGAQINVGGLVASTLNLTDKLFNDGLVSNTTFTPTFEGGGAGNIAVERGAHLQTGPGGRVMLIAPNVSNQGLIETPDGQTILAAGAKAYVASGQDINANSNAKIVGLIVEVDSGGKAINLGDILVGKGDVELVGLAVQQSGRISAKTSVSVNGSIRLVARDTVVNGAQKDFFPKATRGGNLVLGEGSQTEVLPDLDDKETIIEVQDFAVSKISLQGKNVDVAANSRVIAPAGEVEVVAALNPGFPDSFGSEAEKDEFGKSQDALVGIRLGENAVIDVSGTTSTVLPMSRNIVEFELRASELKDSPLQRDGVLRGKNVAVDVRTVDATGHIPLTDVSDAIGLVGKTVEERSAVGGTITLLSHGEVTAAAGSRLDVSGGSIKYDGGTISTTKVVSGDRVFDISKAPAHLIYDGILGDDAVKSDKWGIFWAASGNRAHYEGEYVEGANAGQMVVTTPVFKWMGELKGARTNGPYQRDASHVAKFGSLTIGKLKIGEVPNLVTGSILLQAHADENGALNAFSTEMLNRSGFGEITLRSNADITLAAGSPLHLPVGGSLTLSAGKIDLGSDIIAPSGAVSAEARSTVSTNAEKLDHYNVSLTSGAHISVAGEWTNESSLMNGDRRSVVNVNAGSIDLAAVRDVLVAPGSFLDAQGGAWLRSDGAVQKGNGGSVSLKTSSLTGQLLLGGEIQGFGFGTGGRLSLVSTKKIEIVPRLTPDSPHQQFAPEFFGANGFSTINLQTDGGDLVVADGAVLAPQLRTRVFNRNYRLLGSGVPLSDVGTLSILPDDLRTPINLGFAATSKLGGADQLFRKLVVEEGAKIISEPGAAISLTSNYQLEILGEIRAPAGSISLQLNRAPDLKYYAEQSLWLGSHSVLAANGIERPRRNGVNTVRVVEDAGAVSLLASAGYLMMEPGATIDVSAVKGTADLVLRNGSVPQGIGVVGRAGRVDIVAAEAAFLAGKFSALAADDETPGGEFRIDFGRGAGFVTGGTTWPNEARHLRLRSDHVGTPTFQALGELPIEYYGVAEVDVAGLTEAGFDSVTLHSDDLISVNAGIDWNVPGRLTLDAPKLAQASGGVASITANYIRLGNSELSRQYTYELPQTGESNLSLHGQWIDLIGNFVADHIGGLTIAADQDLRLIGLPADAILAPESSLTGKFTVAGDLTIVAGRVYPVTLTDYTIEATGSDLHKIHFDGLASPGGELLSAGGRLTVKAPVIEQFGDVRAPLGTVALVAANRLELGTNSTTSVAGGGLPVPFGKLENGKDWVYDFVGGGLSLIVAPPEKRIGLTAPTVTVGAGAVIDVSGGGDVSAIEFLSGPGGSRNVLLESNAYAILPSLGKGIAPYDFQYGSSTYNSANRQLSLSGVPGIADGTYTLLPARYALLPGALLVRKVDGLPGLMPGERLAQTDGSVLVAGRLTRPGSLRLDDKWSAFRVAPGALARQHSEFAEETASQFFANLPRTGGLRLPADAGGIAVSATARIQMDGVIRAEHPANARGAQVDINAPSIRIIAPGIARSITNELLLDAGTIARFGAEDLLLGGLRTYATNVASVDVAATRVVVDPGVALEGDTITLVAKDEIRLERGASVRSVGARKILNGQDWVVGTSGDSDGVVLQVSSAANVHVSRQEPKRVVGTLILSQDSVVEGEAVILDVTKSMRVEGRVTARDVLDIGVPRLVFGTAPSQTDGAVLPVELTRNWTSLSRIGLRSYSSVDFYGDVNLGSSSLKKLLIESTFLRAVSTEGAQDIRLTAADLTLRGGKGELAIGNGALGKRLTVAADVLNLEREHSLLEGFSSVVFDVATEVVANGTGSLQAQGEVSIWTSRLTTSTAADYALKSNVGLEIHGGGISDLERPDGLGGKLSVLAPRVLIDGLIDLPSGYVTVNAAGPTGLTVGRFGVIRTAGQHRPLLDGAAFETPGGEVMLQAEQGDLLVERAAQIDVSAGGIGADAGRVDLLAPNGKLNISGTINAMAGFGGRGGVANVDVTTIAGLGQLARKLTQAGFSAAQSYRLRDGNIDLGAEIAVAAGELVFSADNGGINLEGSLEAVRSNGGSVRLVAKNDVSVGAQSVIRAMAVAPDMAGEVELESTSRAVKITEGSRIVVGSAKSGGVVRLISGRDATGQFQVSKLPAASFVNVRDLLVVNMIDESSRVVSNLDATGMASHTISASVRAAIRGDLAGFYGNSAALDDQLSKLDSASLPALRVVPGIRVDVQGDLAVVPGTLTSVADADWNFAGWRYGSRLDGGAEAGLLVLRASGNVTLNSSLSDGFSSSGGLLSGPSWSFRIVAGASPRSADAMATGSVKAGSGSLTIVPTTTRVKIPPSKIESSIASGKWVRTGQGEIRLAAAEDVVLAGVGDDAAVVYTAGVPAAALAGFDAVTGVDYPTRGGNISLRAGHDIRSGPTYQLYTSWLLRRSVKEAGSWGVNYSQFHQGVAALAGGDVTIAAGNDVIALSASVATIGRSAPATKVYQVLNGGDLRVSAGRDVLGSLFYVGRGALTVRAGGRISQDPSPLATSEVSSNIISAVYAVGQGSVDVRARLGVTVDAVVNPTTLYQFFFDKVPGANKTYFFTYDGSTSAKFFSLVGHIDLKNDSRILGYYAEHSTSTLKSKTKDNTSSDNIIVYPANLSLVAPVGDITVEKSLVLMPAPGAQLIVLAGHDIRFGDKVHNGPGILMSDLGDESLPWQWSPTIAPSNPTYKVDLTSGRMHAAQPVHAGDLVPAMVVAGNDITGELSVPKALRLTAGRDIRDLGVNAQNLVPTDVSELNAGRDIVYSAVRDSARGFLKTVESFISINGPGKLFVLAGRNVSLGASSGILSTGNLNNRALADQGADVFVYTGLAANYVDWLQQNIQPQTEETTRSLVVEKLLDFVSKRQGRAITDPIAAWSEFITLPEEVQRPLVLDFISYMGLAADYVDHLKQRVALDSSILTHAPEVLGLLEQVRLRLHDNDTTEIDSAKLWQEFTELPAAVQRPLVLDLAANEPGIGGSTIESRLEAHGADFARKLVEAGISHNKNGNYDVGWNAIANNFPGRSYAGDLDLYFSQIKTLSGGDIRLFVPGGMLNVGVSAAASLEKDSSSLGIVAQGLGRVAIFARGDVLVNQSKVFTLKGGDILIWSSDGSIDAGRGAKTAVSAPKPRVNVDSTGKVTVDYSGAAAGSGIRNINTDPSIVSGTVDLIAPTGNVNAGDAGIGSAGGLRVAAVRVTGADNIQVSGTSTGVPTTDVGSLSVGFAGQADASSNAAKGVQESLAESAGENSATPQADRALAYLEVMIQGFGGDEETDSKKD